MKTPHMPLLWFLQPAILRRSGDVAAVRELRSAEKLNDMEPFYPLHVWVCDKCLLVQLDEYVSPEHIFSEYAYFSSFSTSWLETRRGLRVDDQRPAEARSRRASWWSWPATTATCCSTSSSAAFPCLGIEPAANVAKEAVAKGVETLVKFFGRELGGARSQEGGRPIWCWATTCSPRCPDLNSFVAGIRTLLKPTGTVTIEFPHLHAPRRGQSVRHHLPRALLLLLADGGRADLRRPTA